MTIMKYLAFISLAFSALAEIAKDNGVLVLTDDNFDEAIAQNPNGLLVEMYAPWCGHCKKLAPEYEKAAAELEPKGFSIAKLDATEHKKAAGKYGVRGFPTIKYIGENMTLDYNGGRTAADIVKYVLKKSGPATIALDSKEAADKFIDDSDIAIIGFFSDPASESAKVFETVATSLDDFVFGIVSDSSVISALEAADQSVTLFKKFDDPKATLDATDASVEKITDFVMVESLPSLIVFSPETSQKIFGGPIQSHGIVFADKIDGELEESILKLAKENKGKILHVQVLPTEGRVLEYFGIKPEDCPTFLIADMGAGGKKYPHSSKDFSYEALSKHESEFFSGNLSPFLKSEEPTEEDLAGNVKIIKGKNFQSVVLDNEKDVFVKFYAPWCGHCKALAPVWDEIADKLASVDTIEIAKFDATMNEIDVPGVNVSGFPTLYFFSGKDKTKPKLYSGGRNMDELMVYIQEVAIPFTLPTEEAPEVVEDKKDEL